MATSNIHIELHKITSFGCPWKLLGGPWGVVEEALRCPWGIAGHPLGALGGLQKAPWDISEFNMRNVSKSHMSDHPMMMVKPAKMYFVK